MKKNWTPAEQRRVNTKKHLYKLIFAKTAWMRVLDTCQFIEHHIKADVEHPLYQPMMTAICVMYAKPFTKNTGVGMLSEKLVKFTDKSLSDTHEILMDARNKFYAHTDAGAQAHDTNQNTFPIQDAGFKVEYVLKGGKVQPIVRTGMADMKVSPVVVPVIKLLCEELLTRIAGEEEGALKELLDGTQLAAGSYRINWEEP